MKKETNGNTPTSDVLVIDPDILLELTNRSWDVPLSTPTPAEADLYRRTMGSIQEKRRSGVIGLADLATEADCALALAQDPEQIELTMQSCIAFKVVEGLRRLGMEKDAALQVLRGALANMFNHGQIPADPDKIAELELQVEDLTLKLTQAKKDADTRVECCVKSAQTEINKMRHEHAAEIATLNIQLDMAKQNTRVAQFTAPATPAPVVAAPAPSIQPSFDKAELKLCLDDLVGNIRAIAKEIDGIHSLSSDDLLLKQRLLRVASNGILWDIEAVIEGVTQ